MAKRLGIICIMLFASLNLIGCGASQFAKGNALLHAGDYDKAIIEYEDILQASRVDSPQIIMGIINNIITNNAMGTFIIAKMSFPIPAIANRMVFSFSCCMSLKRKITIANSAEMAHNTMPEVTIL